MSKSAGYPLEAGWRPLLKDLGVRPADLFRRAELPEGLLSRLPTTLTSDEWFRLWTALEVEVGTPTFPLDLIQAASTESLSPPVFAALCSPDLLTAAQRLRDYKRLIAPMRLDVDLDADGLDLTFHWLKPPRTVPVSLITFEFAYVTMLARVGTREHLVPLAVHSTVSPPNAEAFATFLGVPIVERALVFILITLSADSLPSPCLFSADLPMSVNILDLKPRSPCARSNESEHNLQEEHIIEVH